MDQRGQMIENFDVIRVTADHLFLETDYFFSGQMFLYIIFYLAPFFRQLLSEEADTICSCNYLCIMMLIFLLHIEYI